MTFRKRVYSIVDESKFVSFKRLIKVRLKFPDFGLCKDWLIKIVMETVWRFYHKINMAIVL